MLRNLTFSALLCLPLAPAVHAQGRGGAVPVQPGRIPMIDERTTGMQKLDGYFPLY